MVDTPQYPWTQYFANECFDPFHGWVYDVDDTSDVIREFSYATCTSYTVTRSSKRFGEFELEHAKEEHLVRFKDDPKVKHGCAIPSDGAPFIIVGLRRMECHQGPLHKTADTSLENKTDDHPYSLVTNKKKVTGSKKRGCPAVIVLREVIHFPQYQIPHDSQYWRERKSAELRSDLMSPSYEHVIQKKVIYIDLPRTESHQSHIMGKAADLKAPIDERVVKKIRFLVDEGVFNAKEMQRFLKVFVRNELFSGRELPQIINRRYFPSKEDIRKVIYNHRRRTIHSFIDQENLVEKIRLWKEDHPDDSWTVRLSSFVKRPLNEDEDEDDASYIKVEDDSFLLVFQASWQRRLLERYGRELVFLDATYRTTKYALPLFFLCVQTNSGYCVVGAFITEKEDATSISEALQIIKESNPTWYPGGFMIDASEVEANAIHSTFPDSNLFVCDFHRKQAWQRWVNTLKNDVSRQEETLHLLNAVAESYSTDEYERNLRILKESHLWKSQPKLQQYIQTQWLSKYKTWVWAFRNHAMTLVVNTNNGLESQNKVFKYAYLSSQPVKTVSSLMTVLIEDFFVDAERKYLLSNVEMSSGWREASATVPMDLQHRPAHLIHHIQDTMMKATDIKLSSITQKGDLTFYVKSPSSSRVYRVFLGQEIEKKMPECECRAYKRSHLPCKHLCAVISMCQDLNWNCLPPFYINNPLFVIDEECVDISLPVGSANVDQNSPRSFSVNDLQKDTCVDANLTKEGHRDSKLLQSAKRVREVLQYINNLSYLSQSQQTLEKVNDLLQSAADVLKKSCPKSGSLLLEQPNKGPKKKLTLKRKSSVGPLLKDLPARKKRCLSKKEKKINSKLLDSIKTGEKGYKAETTKNYDEFQENTPLTNFNKIFVVSKEDVIGHIKDVVKDMKNEDWQKMVENARTVGSIETDEIQKVACAVLDECCPDEEQDKVLVELSKHAPPGLDMDSTLRLSFLLLHYLVKIGRFPLKRDFAKEAAEARKHMHGLIASLKAMSSSSTASLSNKGSEEEISRIKPDYTVLKKNSNVLPRKSILRTSRQSFSTGSCAKAIGTKKVHFESPAYTEQKEKSLLEQLLALTNKTSLPIKGKKTLFTGGEVLKASDIKTLTGRQWLNDKVINAYLAVLQREQNKLEDNHIYCIPSYMAVLWENNRLDHWMFSKVKFSLLKWVFMPINVRETHWVLLAADISRGEVHILDSLGGVHKHLVKTWIQYMYIRSQKTGDLKNKLWTEGKLTSCRQEDGNACGAFVLLNAMCLTNDIDLRSVSHDHAVGMRSYALSKLIEASSKHPSHRKHCDMVGCQAPASSKRVQCAVCGRWSHYQCVHINEAPKNNDFMCPVCKAQYC